MTANPKPQTAELVPVTDKQRADARRFITACRDFYSAGPDKFDPRYEQYGDLLQAAETLAHAKEQAAGVDQNSLARALREASEQVGDESDYALAARNWIRNRDELLADAILAALAALRSPDAECIGLAEAARDLLEAQKRDERTVGFRVDLWKCLAANLGEDVA